MKGRPLPQPLPAALDSPLPLPLPRCLPPLPQALPLLPPLPEMLHSRQAHNPLPRRLASLSSPMLWKVAAATTTRCSSLHARTAFHCSCSSVPQTLPQPASCPTAGQLPHSATALLPCSCSPDSPTDPTAPFLHYHPSFRKPASKPRACIPSPSCPPEYLYTPPRNTRPQPACRAGLSASPGKREAGSS